MSSRIRCLYEFGPFILDPTENRLLRDGVSVPLTAKVFETLLVLVERGGRLVGKEELMSLVWPDLFVEEANLARCIHTLRKALDEDESGIKHIETVPKRGYRFIVDVRVLEEQKVATKPETETPSEVQSVRVRRFAQLAPFVLILGAVSSYLYFTRNRTVLPEKTPIKSVAVLPFANVGADPQMEYLSDGISEGLINNLSQLPGLKVIARTSSFRYKGKDPDPGDVARSLNVEALVTGKVVRVGDRFKLSVELMDARDRTHVWGDQYDLPESELVVAQAKLSRQIADQLRLKLTTVVQQQLSRRETVNERAYELLLQGRFHWSKGGTDDRRKAIDLFQQSIAIDPQYARAYAELSFRYCELVSTSVLDAKEFMPKAADAASKAVELDENLAEAHLAVARVKVSEWNWESAESEFNRAIRLNPNLARARNQYAFFLTMQGRHEEALAEGKRARELDPLSPTMNQTVGYRLFLARRNDEALDAARKTLEMAPDFPGVHILLGYGYAAKMQYRDAISAYQKAISLGDRSADTQVYLGVAYARAGETSKARVILKRLELSKDYVSPGVLAALYVALGENEHAFAALERAYAGRDVQLGFLRVDSNLDPLRSDRRFNDLLRRVRLD